MIDELEEDELTPEELAEEEADQDDETLQAILEGEIRTY